MVLSDLLFVKQCFKCGDTLSLLDFYVHKMMADGRLNKCKVCTKKDVAERYVVARPAIDEYEKARFKTPERKAKVKEYRKRLEKKNPEKVTARRKLANAIKTGKTIRQPCEVCGEKSQAHHEDYSKPLEVRWLCFKHHREIGHGQTVTFNANK